MKVQTELECCFCQNKQFDRVFSYAAPPKLEVKFQFNASERYSRTVQRCKRCGHFLSVHAMDMSALYGGDYVNSTYGNAEGLRRAFERIIGLDPSKSDNTGRVKRILEFAAAHFVSHSPKTILDVGSGLGVFVYGMEKAGWKCTAVDPDPRAAEHIQKTVGVEAICGDFMALQKLPPFDAITFNKVLEHVEDPIPMLAKSADSLNKNGFIYVEVPDGEAAALEGADREEFAIDHHHIFSLTSLSLLANRAGFYVKTIERLREPSTKYTLRAFLLPRNHDSKDTAA